MGTRQSRVMTLEHVADRAAAYGIPGVTVDGNDVLAVYEACRAAVERARRGKGPTLLECMTYRQKGHSRFDPAAYRPKEEVEAWLKRDPILRLQTRLYETGVLAEAESKGIIDDVKKAVDGATRFALDSPFPAPEEALEDTYVEGSAVAK
jgi:TPP-dependent pyruvate/acetoin dehydrogenase alpha subunit